MRIVPMGRRFILAAGIALTLSACEPVNMYVAHSTVLGLNAAGALDRSSGHLIIGYDRRFGAIIPKSVPVPEGMEAMSVLSCSDLKVDGIFLTGFTEYLATGKAAEGFARIVATDTDPDQKTAMDQMFDCYVTPIPSDETEQ